MSEGGSQHPYARFALPQKKVTPTLTTTTTTSSIAADHIGSPFTNGTHSPQANDHHPTTIPFGLPTTTRSAFASSPYTAANSQHLNSSGDAGTTAVVTSGQSPHQHSSGQYQTYDGHGFGGSITGKDFSSMRSTSPSSSRDVLVPLGSTGARQKLSILSPSSRRDSRATSPLTSPDLSTQISPSYSRRPRLPSSNSGMSIHSVSSTSQGRTHPREDSTQSDLRPPTSSSSIASASSDDPYGTHRTDERKTGQTSLPGGDDQTPPRTVRTEGRYSSFPHSVSQESPLQSTLHRKETDYPHRRSRTESGDSGFYDPTRDTSRRSEASSLRASPALPRRLTSEAAASNAVSNGYQHRPGLAASRSYSDMSVARRSSPRDPAQSIGNERLAEAWSPTASPQAPKQSSVAGSPVGRVPKSPLRSSTFAREVSSSRAEGPLPSGHRRHASHASVNTSAEDGSSLRGSPAGDTEDSSSKDKIKLKLGRILGAPSRARKSGGTSSASPLPGQASDYTKDSRHGSAVQKVMGMSESRSATPTSSVARERTSSPAASLASIISKPISSSSLMGEDVPRSSRSARSGTTDSSSSGQFVPEDGADSYQGSKARVTNRPTAKGEETAAGPKPDDPSEPAVARTGKSNRHIGVIGSSATSSLAPTMSSFGGAPELTLTSTDLEDLRTMFASSALTDRPNDIHGVGAEVDDKSPFDKSLPPTPLLESMPGTDSASDHSAKGEEDSIQTQDEKSGELVQAATPAASQSAPPSKPTIDPATYVPPGALSRTRLGNAVNAEAQTKSRSNSMPSRRATQEGVSRPGEGTRFSGVSTSRDSDDDGYSVDDPANTVAASAWKEAESALSRFKKASAAPETKDATQTSPEKGSLIRNTLLPFLALEAETPNVNVSDGKFRQAKQRRTLFFDWIAHLLIELQKPQTSADRGAILESIACIIESRTLSAGALAHDSIDESKFSNIFGQILVYAVGELNKKGVYQNTLIFSGRLLAVAFFRIEGVATKLLRALPINRFALERVTAEVGWEGIAPTPFESFGQRFPQHLRALCFTDPRAYLKSLDVQNTAGQVPTDKSNSASTGDSDRYLVRRNDIEIEMTGNWLRRWQSDDSELFFSFCRSYHRQLSVLLSSTAGLRKVAHLFFGAPGYAHLATCIHLKCLSLVNRDILSVTTLSSQKTFNPGETANVLSGSTAGKPRHLEAANRRCTAIVVDIVRAPSGNNKVFHPMLSLHIKCLFKRTSLYDVQGVFCLLDWLDGVFGHMDAAELSIEELIDVDFVIDTLSLLLENADHALALMRAIAFIYSNFAVLVSTLARRRRFCEGILLKPAIFHKLFLSWSFTIRAYFLHLLVFRLARVSDFPAPQGENVVAAVGTDGKPAPSPSAVEIARLFNQRLDEIRRRHDELSPPSAAASDDGKDGQEDDGKSTISRRTPSFVSTIRRTSSVVQVEPPNNITKAERVLGIGLPDPVLGRKLGTSFHSSSTDSGGSSGNSMRSRSRAAKWLRALSGSKKQDKTMETSLAEFRPSGISGKASKLLGEQATVSNRPRLKALAPLSELDFSDDDEEDLGDSDEDDDVGDDESLESGSQLSPASSTDSVSVTSGSDGASGSVQQPPLGIDPLLHGDNIAVDTTFDLQSPPPAASNGGTSTHTTHATRAFSKRASILPGPAFDLVGGVASEEAEAAALPLPGSDQARSSGANGGRESIPWALSAGRYPQSVHIYAIQGLREWESVLAEHDEFFATLAESAGPPAVPRLPVQWPAMFSD